MGTIADIKHNLSIGAPKLKSAAAKIHVNSTADSVLLPFTLHGGTTAARVKTLDITLWVPVQNNRGQVVYTVQTRTQLDNNGTGWDLAPKQKIGFDQILAFVAPLTRSLPCLINVTANIGRNTDNPSITIELHLDA